MRIKHLIAASAAALLLLAPAAYAGKPDGSPGQGRQHSEAAHGKSDSTPGPHASSKAKKHAYGRYCRDESKKHVKGEKGTPFSQCVTAMAKLAKDKVDTPKQACRDLSRKHVKGEKGSPHSVCVKGAKDLEDDQAEDDDSGESSDA